MRTLLSCRGKERRHVRLHQDARASGRPRQGRGPAHEGEGAADRRRRDRRAPVLRGGGHRRHRRALLGLLSAGGLMKSPRDPEPRRTGEVSLLSILVCVGILLWAVYNQYLAT